MRPCPFCGEGPLWRARFRPTGERIAICQECDAVWPAFPEAGRVTNYTCYAGARGFAPLWDGLELLSVIPPDEKEDP